MPDDPNGKPKGKQPKPGEEKGPRLFALPETLKRLGAYRSVIEKYVPQIAGMSVLLLTPNDLKESGATVPEGSKSWWASAMQETLRKIPGLNYRPQDLAEQQARDDYAATGELSSMCGQMQRGYNCPAANAYTVLGDTVVIAMPDTPEELERRMKAALTGLPEDLAKNMPKLSPMDLYVLVILHEATHGRQLRDGALPVAEPDLAAAKNPHDLRMKQTAASIARLLTETEADENAIRSYFMMRGEGVKLGAKTPALFEALRAISTLNQNGDFFTKDDLKGHLHDHASNPMLNVLDDAKVARDVFGAEEATIAALRVNTAANLLAARATGRKRLVDWKPDPLERYAAVKFLYDKGYFREGSAESTIAREYLDAFDTFVPSARSSERVKEILEKAGAQPDILKGLEDRPGYRDAIEGHIKKQDHKGEEPLGDDLSRPKPRTPPMLA
jgi:hypothetical protein